MTDLLLALDGLAHVAGVVLAMLILLVGVPALVSKYAVRFLRWCGWQ